MYILIQKDLLAAVYIFGGQNFGYKIGETSSQDHSKCKVFYEIKKMLIKHSKKIFNT